MELRWVWGVVALCAAAGFASGDSESVIVGTEANFDDVITTNSFTLVEFYAPWCGHCKALEPEYATAADTLAEKESAVKLMKVDAIANEVLAKRYEVDAYPTLLWFAGDRPPIEFTGGRTSQDIVAWVTKKSGPNPMPVSSIEEAEAARKEFPTAAFGFFESEEGAEFKAYNEAAVMSELAYYIVTNKEVATHFKVSEFPKVIFFPEAGDESVIFDGPWEAKPLHEWSVGQSLPLVIEFTDQTAGKIFDGPLKQHLLMFLKKSSDDFEGIVNGMKTSAANFRGRLLYIYVDGDANDNGRILDFFGLSRDDLPAYRLIDMESQMLKYAPEAGADTAAETLSAFATAFFDGSLKPHLKSQATPPDWDAKPVKVLTSSNFEQVALDDAKHVLVEFYAPWCGHCKQLAPIYDELAEAYEHDDSVVITKMDATENELARINIESFPTIYLFPKGAKSTAKPEDFSKTYKVYEGERDLAGFLSYLEAETGVSGRRSKQAGNDQPDSGNGDNGAGHEEL